MAIEVDAVAVALHDALLPMGFVRVEKPAHGVHTAWVRETWNTNRGVVLVATGDGPRWAREHKLAVGAALRYVPFFYGMGLQVVAAAPGTVVDPDALQAAVDRVDNQRCIVQSVFGLDTEAGVLGQGRTWGQVVTGRFQDAIAEALGGLGRPAMRTVGPPDRDNPFAPPE